MPPPPSQSAPQPVTPQDDHSGAQAGSSIKQTENRMFRRAALDSYIRGAAAEGAVFEAEPGWIRSSYWALIAGALALLLFVVFGSVNEYATGPAIVKVGEQAHVTAVTDANIAALLVTPGQQVTAGQPIVQLYQGQAIAEYQRLKNEFELRLRQRLMDPDDAAVESALISLQADLELARTNLDQRTMHAELDGTVGDIRIRAGQRVAAGQVLMSVASTDDSVRIIAFLPGRYRPQVEQGMRLRLSLDGYPYSFQYLPLSSVSGEVIGPAEARQFSGDVIGDALDVDGPNFIVEAHLDEVKFQSEQRTYAYHNGMHGRAEVLVSSESILTTLFPALKRWSQ